MLTTARVAEAGSMMPRLLRSPPPYEDESLPGYLVRLTEANCYQLHWWLPLAGFSPRLFAIGWEALLRPTTEYTQLAQLTGLAETVFVQWRLSVWQRGGWHFSQPQVCGLCLRGALYCRSVWDELAVTVCPRHHVRLWERCPACTQPLRWQRSYVSRCVCGADWRNHDPTPLPKAERQANVWLQGEAADENAGWPVLSSAERSQVLVALAAFCAGNLVAPQHSSARNHAALEAAAAILVGGPSAFRQFCAAQSPRRVLWELARTLKALADQPTLAFLCMLLEAQLRSGELAPTFDWEARFLTPAEVNARLGFSVKQGERLLASGKLTLFHDDGATPRHWPQVWLDTRELTSLQAERQSLLTLDATATQLGLTMREVNELRIWQCLSAASGPTVDGFADWRFAPAALNEFTQALSAHGFASLASKEAGKELEDWLNSAEIRLHLECYRLSFGQWLRAVLAGECPCGTVETETVLSLSGLRFAPAAMARYLERLGAPPLPPLTQRVSKLPRAFSIPAAIAGLQQCWEQEQRSHTRHETGGLDSRSLQRIAQCVLSKINLGEPA
jgi:hypothetical protein